MQLKPLNLSLLIGAALSLLSQTSFAQFPAMNQVNTITNNQWANQQMQLNMTMSMMNTFGSVNRSQNSSRIAGKFNDYTYRVKMKDGTEKKVKSYIYLDTSLHKSYLVLDDKNIPKSDTVHRKQKIYADKTVSIDRITETVYTPDTVAVTKIDYFTGIATDSCWLFKVLPGRIALYSFFSEKSNSPNLFDPSTIVAIQYDNGPISHLDPNTLKTFIATDEKAMKYFDKKEYYAAIKKFDKDTEEK